MIFNKCIKIGNCTIDKDEKTFIIAEAGVNHGGDINVAKKLIDLAVNAGVDAVKFQYFKAEHVVLKDAQKALYQKSTTDPNESQFDMLKRLEISREQNLELRDYCKKNNIIFLTTPGDIFSIDEMDILDLPAYKIASTDLTNLPFLKKVAKKGKPMLLSTGMSYLSEIEMALETIYEFNKDVILLQCTANYPIRDDEANLEVINTFKERFSVLVGYSDHTKGTGAAPFAIPMGAKVVEKHFTIDKTLDGPDHKASLSPQELEDFVKLVRQVDKFMGDKIKKPNLTELYTRRAMQRCMVTISPLVKGHKINEEDLIAKRTNGVGISPIYYQEIVGRKLNKDVGADHIIDIQDLE